MYKKYKKNAEFFVVYIKEAHPIDGWRTKANDREGIKVKDPKTDEEREEVASDCAKSMKLTIPFLIDNMKNKAQQDWAGWPDRFYIVGKDGKVAFKGDPGPRGFKPKDCEDALKKLIKK